ncbi:hypothetical protein [Microbacterium sp. CIAB417]|uniref:hypothetical protein n=1 Tax=Microbacterium sp. CIAB417 TaxID=2860287 RepID=UPI001FABDB29|nr:hypothetical protein [Microbacterium sp. CIAB417]
MTSANAASSDAPAVMLQVIEHEKRALARQQARGVPWILLAWGLALLIGFGALWLVERAAVPAPVSLIVCGVAMAGALTVSSIFGARMGRGLRHRGPIEWVGPVFGLTWPVGLLGMFLVGLGLVRNGMDPALLWVFLPVAGVLFVGVMYMIAGGIWPNWPTIAMGAWLVLVAVVAPFTGASLLVLAVAGGGGFLLAAVYVALWIGRRPGASVAQ